MSRNETNLVDQLKKQNRLLKGVIGVVGAGCALALLMGAKTPDTKAKFTEIDVERINIVTPEGKHEMVLANRDRLPAPIVDGKSIKTDRKMPGIIFYNAMGDENGGIIFDGKMGEGGKPNAGVHFSMDRFGGDQQLALGHYESGGTMETGLNVYDRGLQKDYGPLFEAMMAAKDPKEKEALEKRWIEAGGQQTKRLFVGKTRGQSSAVILADAKGKAKIMMLVTPDGKPMLNFLDDSGNVIQSFPESKAAVK
jgi:hypothetical protein